MRFVIFHGYLLHGTGSNVYNAALAQELVRQGHEVHLLCQDRNAARLSFVDALGVWEAGRLRVRAVRRPVRLTVYTPDIGALLPVYVLDAYEGFEAVRFTDLSEAKIARYIEANVAAVRDVVDLCRPDAALANHLVMGPLICARALGRRVPYAVKVHGSALEYTVRRDPKRFLAPAHEGLASAASVLVGSRHLAARLFAILDDPAVEEKTRLSPPGVDTDAFRPDDKAVAASKLRRTLEDLERRPLDWGGAPNAAEVTRAFDPGRELLVAYVGKLLSQKGPDLLLAAWPLVVGRVPTARLCVVGFGSFRGSCDRLTDALARADLRALRELCETARTRSGEGEGTLSYLAHFLDALRGSARESYLQNAPAAASRIHFTGRLEHDQLVHLMAVSEAQVVPSTFDEAFGMVAAEAAACGSLPVCAAHSGLIEVIRELEPALSAPLRRLMSFELGPQAVWAIADRLVGWLSLPTQTRAAAREALAARARDTYGWHEVARRVCLAAQGALEGLPRP